MMKISPILLCACLALTACGQDKTAQKTSAQSEVPATANNQKAGKNTPETASSADRVLSAYRLGGMLEQAQPIIQDALLGNLPAAVNKAQQGYLKEAVAEVYAVDKLLAQVSAQLSQAAEKAGEAEALQTAAEKLETDLSQAMVDRDEAAATDEFAEAFAEFLQEPVADSSDARMATMQGLVDDLKLVELQTVFNIGMMRGMIEARNAAAPEDYSMSQENAEKMVEQTRAGLQEHLTEQVPVMLYFAYREVESEKLQEYVDLQHSQALRWTNQAMIDAMAHTFEAAAAKVPKVYQARLQKSET